MSGGRATIRSGQGQSEDGAKIRSGREQNGDSEEIRPVREQGGDGAKIRSGRELSTERTEKGRDARLSCLRIAATLTVIWLHTNSTPADNALAFGIGEQSLRFHAVMIYLSEWAVAAFMFLTGALLLDPERRFGKRELLKSLRRIVLALIIFGVPFAACRLWLRGEIPGPGLIGKAFLCVLTGKEIGHFWYLYLLMGVYLVLPMLRIFVKNTGRRVYLYALAVLFSLGSVLPQIYLEAGEEIPVPVLAAFPFLPVLAGYAVFRRREKDEQLLRVASLIAIAAGIAWIIPEALSRPYPYASALLSYSSPQVLLLSAAVVLLFSTLPKTGRRSGRILWSFDRLCFAVYLVHPVFLQIIYKYFGLIPERYGHDRLGTILVWLTVTVLSALAAFIMRLIPPLRKYVL